MTELGLYRLLAPQFLAGFSFPHEADAYLSKLNVQNLTATCDGTASVLTGTLDFGDAPREHTPSSSKGGFRWDDVEVRFRLVVPRDGADFIDTAVNNPALPLPALADLLDAFKPVNQTVAAATEYPGVRFRLELLLDELHFELSDDWMPGRLNDEHRIVRDPSILGKCRIILPKVVLSYEQPDDYLSPPALNLVSWGDAGFDAATELLAGELGRMEPPIAVHRDGRLGFGFGTVTIDADPDHTPPEILKFFGADESFEGIYVQSARIYYADEGKDLAINASVKDLLISFKGEVSFEASVDLIGPETSLSASLHVIDLGKNVDVSPGSKTAVAKRVLVSGSKVQASTAAQLQVEIMGGVPPFTISVTADAAAVPLPSDPKTGVVAISGLTEGVHKLTLLVVDGAPASDQQTYEENIELTLVKGPMAAATPAGLPADQKPRSGALPPITTTGGTAVNCSISPAGSVTPDGTMERFRITGVGTPTVTVKAPGGTTQAATVVDGLVTVDVPPNTANLVISATWPASAPDQAKLQFTQSWPVETSGLVGVNQYVSDPVPLVADSIYRNCRAPGQSTSGSESVRAWLRQRAMANAGVIPSVTIDAYASCDKRLDRDTDQPLSERRLQVALGVVAGLATVTHQEAHGQDVAWGANRFKDPADRVAIINIPATNQAEQKAELNVSRAARANPTPAPAVAQPNPPPKPLPNKGPGVFRRIGIRVKVLRNDPVLLELSGRLDFETDAEARLRNPNNPDGSPPLDPGGSLGLKQQAAAVAAPTRSPQDDGVVDFRLTIVHDLAIHSWTETLAIGAHPDDVDGLLQTTNSHPGGNNPETVLKDVLGSVMILAPIIGTAVGATDPNSAGSYAVLSGGIVGAAAIGAAGFIQTSKITLYGVELRFRQFIPASEGATFSDAGVILDYAVEFGVKIKEFGIETKVPLKVRYRAIGFNLNFTGGGYRPIFDTSKGYELNLSDPGLFSLPSPIDNVLKILGARIAKVNPLTVELDLGMKVDLGVVTIDRFKVKVPVQPLGVPTILPSGIKVDISKVLVGSGYVNIIDPPVEPPSDSPKPSFGGIEGAFDVTLQSLKLRIAASFGIRPVKEPSPGVRSATAVFLGLIIDLPSPILLTPTPFGIYGFAGLFAMHYKRIEKARDPKSAVGPAIQWLQDADGQPARLFYNYVKLWDVEWDRWSFGVGVSIGSTDGGFLVNLRGMFVLELPGPRILIFIKMLIVKDLPAMSPAKELTAGILGVVDLDFQRSSLTLGIIVNLEIKEIVSVVLPVELYADFKVASNWHLFVGTFNQPGSAMVLNVVRGFGYVMISGNDILDWPGYPPRLPILQGVAMAAGIGGAIVLGDEGIGLFLKVSLRADVAVTFSPRLHVFGRVQLEGELRLFIVSVGAHGTLDVETPDPTYLYGEICGHVDLFFFKVSGCVTIDTRDKPQLPEPPNIVRNVWLQSHAPVITVGQAGDRPIDASVGDAVRVPRPTPDPHPPTIPVVPIDAIPVVQFAVTPTLDPLLGTFTSPLTTPPGLPPDGWVDLSATRRVTYALTALRLEGKAPGPGTPQATWRLDIPASSMKGRTNIDLALMSSVPMRVILPSNDRQTSTGSSMSGGGECAI